MAILLKVNWVDKADTPELHLRISYIGGISNELRWRHSREQAIESIERGRFTYFIDRDSRILRLNVGMTCDGEKYLKLDNADSQLLLDLPEFPVKAPVNLQPSRV